MKKSLAFLLAVLMLLSALTGCGSKSETQTPSTQPSETSSTTNSGEKTEEPSAAEAAYKDTVIWAQASDVTTVSSNSGWRRSSRTSSIPANPAAPTTPAFSPMVPPLDSLTHC